MAVLLVQKAYVLQTQGRTEEALKLYTGKHTQIKTFKSHDRVYRFCLLRTCAYLHLYVFVLRYKKEQAGLKSTLFPT